MARRMTRKHRKNPKHKARHRRLNPKGVPRTAEQKAKAAATRAGKASALAAALAAGDVAALQKLLGKKAPSGRKRRSKEEIAAAKAATAERKAIRAKAKSGITLTAAEIAAIARKPSGKPRKARSRKAGTPAFERHLRAIARDELAASGSHTGSDAAVGPLVMTVVSSRGKNKGKSVTRNIPSARAMLASRLSRKHKGDSRSAEERAVDRAIAGAWRKASKVSSLPLPPEKKKLLRAFGLAEVPNPGMGGLVKDIGTLLPQMGVSVVALAGSAWAGQMVGDKLPDTMKAGFVGKAAPSLVSAAIGVAGYMALRKSPSMAKFAPAVLFGGVAAAAVHAIARIPAGDSTLGKKLGLPVGEYASMAGYGEYASMAGFGEYAAMAGGTGYAGERGIFAGLDDTDPVLAGTDDEDDVDFTETLSDEGVNADEGSLNGSIFD